MVIIVSKLNHMACHWPQVMSLAMSLAMSLSQITTAGTFVREFFFIVFDVKSLVTRVLSNNLEKHK